MQCNVTILHDGNDVSACNPLEATGRAPPWTKQIMTILIL